jgi:DNA-binding IclR family transcriptional regulator
MKAEHRVLLEISSFPDGYTLTDLTQNLKLPKKDVAKYVGELETLGVVRGFWVQRESDNRWVRKYAINVYGEQSLKDNFNLERKPVDYPDLE